MVDSNKTQQSPPLTARSIARSSISQGSKSFALASRILPSDKRVDAWLLYSFCRHADDVIDDSPADAQESALQTLRDDIARLYGNEPISDPLWLAFRDTLRRRKLPRQYLETLVDGMQMDVEGHVYETLSELLLYCHRVAGIVGWMMVQILGISRRQALRAAAQLGIAMQLTNICRDVAEDWNKGRLYLPNDLLKECDVPNLRARLGGPFPRDCAHGVRSAVGRLLTLADQFYVTSDSGLMDLDFRSAFAIRTARLVYAEIGEELRAKGCNVLSGRSIVATNRKLQLLGRSAMVTLSEVPMRLRAPHAPIEIDPLPVFPEDVLP